MRQCPGSRCLDLYLFFHPLSNLVPKASFLWLSPLLSPFCQPVSHLPS